jgi:RNA polymerase sigma-70 factor (ECF subfamily)
METAAPVLGVSIREEPNQAIVAGIADFDAVVRAHWTRVYRYALASLRDRDAAQTIAQDCFVKAYRARDRFRGEASVHTWLMQIAVNLVRDHTRSRRFQFWKRAPAIPADGAARNWIACGEIDPEQRVLVKEQVSAMWSATTNLPEKQRTVFLLRYVEEMDLLEIVAVTGLSEGAVKVHLYRALRSVRKFVESLR